MNALLFDIGATQSRFAVTRDGRRFSKPVIIPTLERFADAVREYKSLALKLAGGRPLTAAVGGVAGPMRTPAGILVRSIRRDWIGQPVRSVLRRIFSSPLTLENDAALCGLGEVHFGAGQGAPIVAYLTVSSGVGGARYVDGRIDRSSAGFEPGEMIIGPGQRNLAFHVSGTAFQRRFRRSPWTIRSPRIWQAAAGHLAHGLVTISALWSPQVIVLGGSMLKNPGISIPAVRQEMSQAMANRFAGIPEIRKARLNDVGGLYGALALIKQRRR